MKKYFIKNANQKEKNINRNSVGIELERTSTLNICSGWLRRVSMVLALFFVITLTANNVAVAQQGPPAPPPDCPTVGYEGPFNKMVTLPNGCVIFYTFYYRFACGYHDIYIDNYHYMGPCDDIDIMSAIREHIVKVTIPGFKDEYQYEDPDESWYKPFEIYPCGPGSLELPDNPSCGDEFYQLIRFWRPTCTAEFIYISPDGDEMTISVPCPVEGYCYEVYCYCLQEVDGVDVLVEIRTGFGAYKNTIKCDGRIVYDPDGNPIPCGSNCW